MSKYNVYQRHITGSWRLLLISLLCDKGVLLTSLLFIFVETEVGFFWQSRVQIQPSRTLLYMTYVQEKKNEKSFSGGRLSPIYSFDQLCSIFTTTKTLRIFICFIWMKIPCTISDLSSLPSVFKIENIIHIKQ